MWEENMFGNSNEKLKDFQESEIVFVADLFVDEYAGGAELTSQALIDSCPMKISKLRSHEVNMNHLKDGHKKFWIFGNFANLNPNLIPTIIGNMNYAILEYDFKFCKFRSPEKHLISINQICDCSEQMNGKLISAFFHGSKYIAWMSEKQRDLYHKLFPFLYDNDQIVLSSIFDQKTIFKLKELRTNPKNDSWIVLGSNSWIKGIHEAETWCKQNQKSYEIVWNLPYDQVLEKLSKSCGFVYLPLGFDTCPRMVIEAKLLGCELELNDNVLHKNEEWFDTSSFEEIEEYLLSAPSVFWNSIKNLMNYRPTISGYLTTRNCIEQKYPFRECIQSMLNFCDEVCIVDDSSDGTWEELQKLQKSNEKVIVKRVERDWSHPRSAVFDGLQKAEARKMCTKEFCIQFDADERFSISDGKKIKDVASSIPKSVDLVALPVIEFWGGYDKVRLDVTPWKWRLSRNKPNITHGIPRDLRMFDENGNLYSRIGSDGCDYIDADTFKPIPFMNFYSQEADQLRKYALMEDKPSLERYNQWFNNVIEQIPSVFHYSWIDIERKIKLYKNYWQNHWLSLHNQKIEDTAENNMFFDKPWCEVTNDMIKSRAKELAECGGHIFHTKYNGEYVPWLTIKKKEDEL